MKWNFLMGKGGDLLEPDAPDAPLRGRGRSGRSPWYPLHLLWGGPGWRLRWPSTGGWGQVRERATKTCTFHWKFGTFLGGKGKLSQHIYVNCHIYIQFLIRPVRRKYSEICLKVFRNKGWKRNTNIMKLNNYLQMCPWGCDGTCLEKTLLVLSPAGSTNFTLLLHKMFYKIKIYIFFNCQNTLPTLLISIT